MDITWDAPLGNCDVSGYDIVVTTATGTPSGVGPCSYYRLGVQAMPANGSPLVTLPSHDVFLSGLAAK